VQSFDKAYKPFTISNPINWYSFKLTTWHTFYSSNKTVLQPVNITRFTPYTLKVHLHGHGKMVTLIQTTILRPSHKSICVSWHPLEEIKIFSKQSFTAWAISLMDTSTLKLHALQCCYVQHLRTINGKIVYKVINNFLKHKLAWQ